MTRVMKWGKVARVKIACVLICTACGWCAAAPADTLRRWWFPGEHLDAQDRLRLQNLVEEVPVHRLKLWTRSPQLSTAIQPLNLHYIREGRDEALLLDGDFRWLVRDLQTFENVSASPHLGFNYGAYHYLHAGHLFSFGGSGYWTAHNQLVVFSDQTQGFEWVSSSHPGMTRFRDQHVFQRGVDLVCLQHIVPSGQGEDEIEVWSRPPTGAGWRYEGTFRLAGGEWTPGLEYYELEDYVLFPNINRGLLVVRKRDLAFMELPVHPLGMATQSGQMRPNGHGNGWGTTADAVYRLQNWQVVDTLFHARELPAGAVWSMPQRTASNPQISHADAAEIMATGGIFERMQAWMLGGALVVLGGVGGWYYRRKRTASGLSGRALHSSPVISANDHLGDATEFSLHLDRWSKGLTDVICAPEGAWEVDAFARLMGLDPTSHPETLRSQRARAFQQVNEESLVVFGYEILIREKHPRDARAVVYRRAPMPRFIVEAVERHHACQEMPSER